MAPSQRILFTVMPRSLSLNADRLPISVFVSPRLYGETVLGAFPDWVDWTGMLREHGMFLQFEAGGQPFEARVNTKPLRPDLWRALFNQGTPVRSHAFDDHSGTGVISYSMRAALSAIKSLYQEASVALALPDADEQRAKEGNRQTLRQLLSGLEVHWDDRRGREWRQEVARQAYEGNGRYGDDELDDEGLLFVQPNADDHHEIAKPFSTFHHMPQIADEEPAALPLDVNSNFDFHTGLAGLNSYSDLLRALGLVLDFDLDLSFVPPTALPGYATISVRQAAPGWELAVPTDIPPLETAYVHLVGDNFRLFAPAPRVLKDQAFPTQVLGLLNLDPAHFGLAQVEIDGALHKAIMTAEVMHPAPESHLGGGAQPAPAQHPTIYDPDATLPALRSGGIQLYADGRAAQLLQSFNSNKRFNDALEGNGPSEGPFFAEDLLRGYRLDVQDAETGDWYSLHQRSGAYEVGEELVPFDVETEEGFTQLAATRAVKDAPGASGELYLHEAIARWAGWSLSVPMPGKALSKYGDPKKAIPQDGDPNYDVDQPATPFIVRAVHKVIPRSLPKLRFGRRYRIRARAVDLCGNSMKLGEPVTDGFGRVFALPRDPEGTVYLRYEPVISPQIILRDIRAVTDPGSYLDRLVIRTHNSDESLDTAAADLAAADRHIVPPRTSVELGERLGMFDDPDGTLNPDPATYALISQRDGGEFAQAKVKVAGQDQTFPLEPAEMIDTLPHLPDPLARGAALRGLPGTPGGSIGRATDGTEPAAVKYTPLDNPNPRPGSVTLLPFGNGDNDPDWQALRGVRLALAEPPASTTTAPQWDAVTRTLMVFLPKGEMAVVPLSSYCNVDDLRLMGIWQWLREHIERITVTEPRPAYLQPGEAVDEIAHILQRAVEGGHWMLTPPKLLTLVHAVQQPLGRPRFMPLTIDFQPLERPQQTPLQAAPSRGRPDPAELAAITAWRRPNATDAYLLGALQIHGASTGRVDLEATWEDPVDDPDRPEPTTVAQRAQVETLPLDSLREDSLRARGKEKRAVGYYDPEHDQIAFVRAGERLRSLVGGDHTFSTDAAPRHLLNDTKRHRITYTATSTSRYQEYFAQDAKLSFTRTSAPLLVDVPASARPLAPSVQYVLPTFGWQRQTETNMQRSVRFGGGLRVYLDRPWFSSGDGELLGATLYGMQDGPMTDEKRRKWNPYISQWGMDPIWETGALGGYPGVSDFPDHAAEDYWVALEESAARTSDGSPGLVNVVGFPVTFDVERGLWYSDLTLNIQTQTYAPFVRLALVRYQPHALPDARISRVVLADFAQLTPDRSALVTVDPYHPRQVRVVVSGVAPRGPLPAPWLSAPTVIRVRVQRRNPQLASDLAWEDAPADEATVAQVQGTATGQPDLALYQGTVTFAQNPEPGRFRLLIEEHEYVAADPAFLERGLQVASRLMYAEVFELDGGVAG